MEDWDIDYFIDKFEALPHESWGNPYDLCTDDEAEKLFELVRWSGILSEVNDGIDDWDDWGDEPQERVLAFLYNIKLTGLENLHNCS